MKKNMMLRFTSVLLVAVLLSTCAISGTFAKYVTTKAGTDSARVAKWGVSITANGSTFANEYATDEKSVVGTIAKSVISSEDNKNVVAPGTGGSMVAMTISGSPEVAVTVAYSADLALTGWTLANDAVYCPIVITVGSTEYKIDGTTITDLAGLESAVEAAINGYTANYGPNTDLSSAKVPSVSWAWAYTTDTTSDANDTYLGDKADENNASTISLTVTTTVTQIN